ncbi:MAG: isopentenyl-diphosphate Delta-isomerase [Candidatus Micrarchaeaceae archaeon]
MEKVILVDDADNEIGTEEKIEAHKKALLHRALSICVFNDKGEMLIQKRNINKYHSGGLWANTCCSHPRPNEKTEDAAHRRLVEEMGFDCKLEEKMHFIYFAKLDHGLTEHELDHLFIGRYNGEVKPDPNEVEDYKWISLEELKKDMQGHGDKYTAWFKIIVKKLDEKN